MATSPNYSWPEPDNTDLVKNGALAMRTLGNAIDTTMATMTPKSTVTAKGSLIAATAASTPANLAVGNNGETLVADSSTSTGLRYQAPVNSNPVLNSAMQIWQRGTSFAVASSTITYTADRWSAYRAAATGMTISRQTTNDTTNLPFIQYCARIARDSGNTSTASLSLSQSFESVNSIAYAGKTVTVSFYARKGANYSPTTNYFVVKTGTGTDQNIYSGFTGSVNAIIASPSYTTSWARYTYTVTLDSNITQIAVEFNNVPVGTAGAADYLEVTGIQLEVGSVATPFKTATGTIQGELAACQRYYWRFGGDSVYQYLAQGYAISTTQTNTLVYCPVPMRTAPSSIDFSTLAVFDGGTLTAVTNATIETAGKFTNNIRTTVASGLTNLRTYSLITNNSLSGYIGLSAEL